MPSPNPNYNDIVTTTIENRSKELADNISLHNEVLKRLESRGNIDPIDGGHKIVEEIEYAENSTFKWYTGYEVVDVSPQELFTSAEYALKLATISVTISGTELLQNSGRERFIPLLKRKMQNAETSFKNNLLRSVFSDGTANSGKQIGGIQAQISTTPTLGSVGNISRVSNTWWRNKKFSGTTDGGAAVSSSNIQGYMTALALQLVRGSDFPDLIVADANYYKLYTDSLQPQFRVTTNDSVGSGFKSLKFFAVGNDVDVVFAGNGVGMPSNQMYFLDTKYLRLRPHRDRNMVPIGGDRQPTNQDAIVKLLGWAGNMTMSNAAQQGVLFA